MARKQNNTPQPWERQEGETAKQYEAFCVYRDMKTIRDPNSKRSIRLVSEQLGKSEGLLERWSSANNWVERVDAWDMDQERIAREIAQKEAEEEIRKMRKRQAEAGKFAQIKAIKALNRIPDDEIKPGDVARLLEVGSKLERTARGDVGEVIEERQGESIAPAVTFYIPDNGRDRAEDEETDDDATD